MNNASPLAQRSSPRRHIACSVCLTRPPNRLRCGWAFSPILHADGALHYSLTSLLLSVSLVVATGVPSKREKGLRPFRCLDTDVNAISCRGSGPRIKVLEQRKDSTATLKTRLYSCNPVGTLSYIRRCSTAFGCRQRMVTDVSPVHR
jgi:hypothetical protein